MSESVESRPAAGQRLIFWETTGSVLWFSMDVAWLFEAGFTVIALLMVLTIAANLIVFAYIERTYQTVALTAALNCWVVFNVFWLIWDIHEIPWCLAAAKIFAVLGSLFLLASFLLARNAAAARRFRRLRID